MEQLLGAQQQRQQHHQPHRSISPRTPTRPHLQHIPSNRFRDHHRPQPHAGLRILRITPPFFLLLLAAVYLLASFTILSAPAASLRPAKNPNRLIVPMPPPSPDLFELDNGRIRARISNVGATVTSLLVPDKNGVLGDVVLGFDSLDPYLNGTSPYFGCIVGRVANRIKDGKFTLNGVQHSLSINSPPNTLHGKTQEA
ncbi:hypothetical protein ACQ4PT_042952 [Festuca glaucescens]